MEYIDITRLKINPKNPRKIDEENFERLKRDIKRDFKFLEKRPLLVYEDPDTKELITYCGNMRLKACLALGVKEVPVEFDKDVIRDGKLDKGLMTERLLRDNESYGGYDTDLLSKNFNLEELKSLDLPELNIMLNVINLQNNFGDKKENSTMEWTDLPEFKKGIKSHPFTLNIYFKDESMREEFIKLNDIKNPGVFKETIYAYIPPKEDDDQESIKFEKE